MTEGEPLICRTTHHVRFAHLSPDRHMNQAVYAEISEQERVRWMAQSGILRRWRAAGVRQLVARQAITYRHALRPLQRYTVDTRAVGMDGRLLRFEQHFLVGEQVCALNEVTLIFASADGALSPDAAAAICAEGMTSPLRVVDWRAESFHE
ncbi:MAG: acyl-CoA thioesterase FadM [Myxococcota bacterium]|jgi:acyl-CoA thioesterase FadM